MRSASGGRTARLTIALAEASEVQSNDASRATMASTKASSSASGKGAGDPAPSFGGGCVVVGAGEDDLQCAVTTDGARKQLRAATTGQQATADLGLPEDRLLTAGVAQVECECEVTAAPGGRPRMVAMVM